MGSPQTITLRGVEYDIESGSPVKPAHTTTTTHHITKFAAHPSAPTKPRIADIAPMHHPATLKAHATQALAKQKRVLKPSAVIKQQAIAEAMAASGTTHRKPYKIKKTRSALQRTLQLSAGGLALLLFGGYLTYLNMPAISTHVAAAQAGINATYPSYQPSGYRLSGPVAFSNGAVSMTFAANAGPQNYSITESRSTWDSTAVLENYVVPKAGADYATTQANGLTIYTYGQNAAWINGGILYTIGGNAPLSSEQVQRIATSM